MSLFSDRGLLEEPSPRWPNLAHVACRIQITDGVSTRCTCPVIAYAGPKESCRWTRPSIMALKACKSRGITVKDPQDWGVKVVPDSFKELLAALLSGEEAITSSKHQSHKITTQKKKNPNTIQIQSWFLSCSGLLSYPRTITARMLTVNSRWKQRSPPHQLRRTPIHRLLRDTSKRRLFQSCGGEGEKEKSSIWKREKNVSDRAESNEVRYKWRQLN